MFRVTNKPLSLFLSPFLIRSLSVEDATRRNGFIMSKHYAGVKGRIFVLAMLSLGLIASYLSLSPTAHAQATPVGWKTFHDPLYGFTLSYPDTWMLIPEQNGSHITLLNPATQTTMSPIVTTQAGTPTDVLQQNLGVKAKKSSGHRPGSSRLPGA